MTEKEIWQDHEDRIRELEKNAHEQEKEEMKHYRDLEQLVAKAVKEGNKEIYEEIKKHKNLFDNYEIRITALENADAKKALEQKNALLNKIAIVIITFIITLFLNSMVDTISRTIRYVNEQPNNNINQEAQNEKN